jgi:hypothetical protein
VLHLQLVQIGITAWDPTKFTAAQAEAQYKLNITNSVAEIELIQRFLSLEAINISLSSDHKKLLTSNEVEMKEIDGSITKFDLNEAIKQIIGKAIRVSNMAVASITPDNIDVFFLNYNMFNKFYQALMLSGEYFLTELKDR